MVSTHKAIVFNSLKYSDSDLIVKCYTEIGLKSYLIKGIFSKKKKKITPAFFTPLTQLEITADYKSNKSLHFIKDLKLSYPYHSIFNDIAKQTIVLFLSEVLSNSIKEEEENKPLFSYLETSLKWLDTHENIANFHLLFLMNLTKYLGFYPEQIKEALYFDLVEGKFTNSQVLNPYISGDNLIFFKALLGTNFDVLDQLKLHKNNRQELLESLIQYFELHLPGYRKPKSLEVLKTVFN